MSGVKKIDLFLVSLLPGQQHTEAEMVWSSPQQCIEERERDMGRRGGEGGRVLLKEKDMEEWEEWSLTKHLKSLLMK